MRTNPPVRRAPEGAHLRGGVLRFYVLVVVLSLPFWLMGTRALPVPMRLPVSALQAVCPVVAAVVLTYRAERSDGVRRLLRRAVDRERVTNAAWYVPGVLTMPAITALAYAVMRLADRPLPEPDIPLSTLPALLAGFLVMATAEELGWSGYAVDRMQRRWSALTTGLTLGAMWAVWHLVPLVQAGRAAAWIAWWAVNTVAMRVLIVWIYNNAGGTVLTAVLFHTTSNVAWSLFPNSGSHFDPAFVGALTALTALAVTVLWGPDTLTRTRPA